MPQTSRTCPKRLLERLAWMRAKLISGHQAPPMAWLILHPSVIGVKIF